MVKWTVDIAVLVVFLKDQYASKITKSAELNLYSSRPRYASGTAAI